MGSAVHKANKRKLFLMLLLVAVAAAAYLTVDVSFSNERLFRYAMKIRIPKLIVMQSGARLLSFSPLSTIPL